jgi:hypothetical protein
VVACREMGQNEKKTLFLHLGPGTYSDWHIEDEDDARSSLDKQRPWHVFVC